LLNAFAAASPAPAASSPAASSSATPTPAASSSAAPSPAAPFAGAPVGGGWLVAEIEEEWVLVDDNPGLDAGWFE
jgi:hypothetical protein